MPPRSLFLAVLLLFALAFTVTACGASSSGAAGRTLRIWYSTDDPVERTWSQQLAKRFEVSHPGVTVNLVDYSFEDLNTKLQLALNGGDPPDLAYVTPRGPGIPAYVGAHKLLDLTGPAKRGAWAQRLRPGLLGSYNQPFWHEGAGRGQILAVPMALAAVGVMYNQRLLKSLGLSVPTTIATFEAALVKAKAAGFIPVGLGNADGWLGDDWYLALVNGLIPPSKLAPALTLSSSFTFKAEAFHRAARLLKSWADARYFTPEFGGLDAQESIDAFFAGHTLFQLISSSENSQIQRNQKATGLPVGVFGFPASYGGTVMPMSGYLGWVVPKQASNKSDATSFIESLLTPGTADFLASKGVISSLRFPLAPNTARWVREYVEALDRARPGVYLDAAPISNINATMEANVQLLLQGYESPSFLPASLQEVYVSHGKKGSTARIDGEF